MTKSFDVFLSHNSKDKPAVRELAEALRARGLKGWLDEWELVPGRPWQEALEEIVETTRASAVLVGKDGLGPWHDAEMRGCLSEFVHHKLPVIPVSRACFGRAEEGQTAPVGFFPAGRGPFGTLDQAGNVWEWCQDVLDKTAYVKRGREPLDPIERGEAGKQRKRAIRGGSWLFSEEGLRAAFRHGFPPKTKVNWIGFRVATPSLHPSTPVSR